MRRAVTSARELTGSKASGKDADMINVVNQTLGAPADVMQAVSFIRLEAGNFPPATSGRGHTDMEARVRGASVRLVSAESSSEGSRS